MFDVDHIAKLARMGIVSEEKEKFTKELLAILAFVEKLNEVDVSGVEPTSQATGLKNETRTDRVEKNDEPCRRQILANAPEIKDNHIKVRAVFE